MLLVPIQYENPFLLIWYGNEDKRFKKADIFVWIAGWQTQPLHYSTNFHLEACHARAVTTLSPFANHFYSLIYSYRIKQKIQRNPARPKIVLSAKHLIGLNRKCEKIKYISFLNGTITTLFFRKETFFCMRHKNWIFNVAVTWIFYATILKKFDKKTTKQTAWTL